MVYTEETSHTRDTNPHTSASSSSGAAPTSAESTERNDVVARGDGHVGDGPLDDTSQGHPLPSLALEATTRRRKKPGQTLKNAYTTTLMIGFVLSLLLVLGLTQLRFDSETPQTIQLEAQEVVVMEEIKQTKQDMAPPPPPRPMPPIEVPNNTLVETQSLDFDATLDLDASLSTDGPPPEAPPPPEPQEEEGEDEIFVAVEDDPVLIGGLEGLQDRIEYPEMARNAGIDGRVIVQFIVDENGNVIRPTVVRGRHPSLDEEALRVIRQAQFEPGRQRGTAVKVQMALPITFKLANR